MIGCIQRVATACLPSSRPPPLPPPLAPTPGDTSRLPLSSLCHHAHSDQSTNQATNVQGLPPRPTLRRGSRACGRGDPPKASQISWWMWCLPPPGGPPSWRRGTLAVPQPPTAGGHTGTAPPASVVATAARRAVQLASAAAAMQNCRPARLQTRTLAPSCAPATTPSCRSGWRRQHRQRRRPQLLRRSAPTATAAPWAARSGRCSTRCCPRAAWERRPRGGGGWGCCCATGRVSLQGEGGAGGGRSGGWGVLPRGSWPSRRFCRPAFNRAPVPGCVPALRAARAYSRPSWLLPRALAPLIPAFLLVRRGPLS